MCDCGDCADADALAELTERLDEIEDQAVGGRKVAQTALQRTAELEAALERIDELEERVEALESSLGDIENKPYELLSRSEKVALVRKYLIDRAEQKSSRKHTLTYDDIQWSVFDGEPSDGHCYHLLKEAAQHPGFTHTTDPHRVAVDLTELNDQADRSSVNNAVQGVGN